MYNVPKISKVSVPVTETKYYNYLNVYNNIKVKYIAFEMMIQSNFFLLPVAFRAPCVLCLPACCIRIAESVNSDI
ncbi:hypothetical protein PUN28_008263 [Cardiocondyla obscurior]|uniref:Uncharacterized protein n=1 Tax=Cardiocondyla obscurior TaxID=286306 RepID=A0AAW2FYW1_9HYME